MVSNKQFVPVSADELLARANLCVKLMEVIDEVTRASEFIKDGGYWDAYRMTSKIEFMVAEVSADLHNIDIAMGEEGKP